MDVSGGFVVSFRPRCGASPHSVRAYVAILEYATKTARLIRSPNLDGSATELHGEVPWNSSWIFVYLLEAKGYSGPMKSLWNVHGVPTKRSGPWSAHGVPKWD